VSDCIIDTNVLLVASAHHPDSPFKDSDVPIEQLKEVFEWLTKFRVDGQRKIVLDQFWKIMAEYRHKMTDQDFGLQVVKEKLQQSARFIDVPYDRHGHGRLPPELEKVIHDKSDRKFVATALIDVAEGGQSTIINAVDSDWCDWEDALGSHGITVTHLIEDLCRDKHPMKTKRKAKR